MCKIFTEENNSIYMNENIQTVKTVFDEQGWNYELKDNQFKISFLTNPKCKIPNKLHLITVFPDKLYTTTALGIKVVEDNLLETYKLINFINSEQLYYGRFIIAKSGTIWYDYSIDIMHCDLTETMCHKAVNLPDSCVEKYCNSIFDVSAGFKTAEDIIQDF